MGVPFLLYCALIFYQTGKKLSTGNLLCCDEQKMAAPRRGSRSSLPKSLFVRLRHFLNL